MLKKNNLNVVFVIIISKVEKDDKTVITDFDLKFNANIFPHLGIACSHVIIIIANQLDLYKFLIKTQIDLVCISLD
jgi:hypothetical protein